MVIGVLFAKFYKLDDGSFEVETEHLCWGLLHRFLRERNLEQTTFTDVRDKKPTGTLIAVYKYEIKDGQFMIAVEEVRKDCHAVD